MSLIQLVRQNQRRHRRRQLGGRQLGGRQPTATDRCNRPWQPIMITDVKDHQESIPMVE